MIENIAVRKNLTGLARKKKRSYIARSVSHAKLDEMLESGWRLQRKNKLSCRITKPKSHSLMLEDRVWSLLYRMEFVSLSGDGGAQLVIDPNDEKSPRTQMDVVGIDTEIALAVECKSSTKPRKDPKIQEVIAKLAHTREKFARYANAEYREEHKLVPVLAVVTSNIELIDNDRKRAQDSKVVLFDQHDVAYYEMLVSQLGPGAKYQFFADLVPGHKIPGLRITIPALKTKMGPYICYNFSITPEYLLKIAFVSHRSKGRAYDVDAYQRMVSKTRLKKIRDYITQDGLFPTNIVISMENTKFMQFDIGKQEGCPEGAQFGWLTLSPAYKSAWIIDGQHRLFGYSGHERAATSYLNVLAFEGLPPDMQAKLFIDINHEQKSVKRSLLHELYAELHWNSPDPEMQIRAIISKAVQSLGEELGSPLHGRILLSDIKRDETRCISLESVFKALNKSGFFISRKKRRKIVEYGPLWDVENNATLVRTVRILKEWFSIVANTASDWWVKGRGDGGGLAMNEGVTVCINVLNSVLAHLQEEGHNLVGMSNDQVVSLVSPFGESFASYLASFSQEERLWFRSLRGVQGQTRGTRQCEWAVRKDFPRFDPKGLSIFIQEQEAKTNDKARQIIDKIERMLQVCVISRLKEEYGEEKERWWFEGVPSSVMKKVYAKVTAEKGKRESYEEYFEFIQYREIIQHNWKLFKKTLGYGEKGTSGAEKRTSWVAEINEIRKIAAHASVKANVSFEQLARLEVYEEWLRDQIETEQSNELGPAESVD